MNKRLDQLFMRDRGMITKIIKLRADKTKANKTKKNLLSNDKSTTTSSFGFNVAKVYSSALAGS